MLTMCRRPGAKVLRDQGLTAHIQKKGPGLGVRGKQHIQKEGPDHVLENTKSRHVHPQFSVSYF
jgi:hypothetical protein